MKFTVKTIESLKPRPLRYERYEETGLGVRIGTNGSRTWIWRYKAEDGRHRKMKLGTYPAMTLAEARESLASTRVAVQRGQDPAAEQRAKDTADRNAETVDGLWTYFEQHYVPRRGRKAELSERTRTENLRIYKKDIRPEWGNRKAHSITRRDVSTLVLRIKERALKTGRPDARGTAANRTLSLINTLFAFGLEHGLVHDNPAAGLRGVVKAQPRERVLNDQEIKTLWRALPQTPWALALKLALVTGQRIGAVVAAQWSEFELDQDLWTVPATPGRKNTTQNPIPLTPLASALLHHVRRLSGESDHLFPTPRRAKAPHLRVDSVGTAITRANLPVTGWTPHDLRRTALTGLRDLGVTEETASRIAGHAPSTVLGRVYDQSTQLEPKRRALESWADELMRRVRSTATGSNVLRLQGRV
jgi:integrase